MDTAALARELFSSYTNGLPIPAPPSSLDGAFDMNAAYEVESAFGQLRAASGHGVSGRKVGYANKAMWRALKLETLVWASMYDDTIHYAAAPGEATLVLDRMIAPRLEPEIVFKLKRAPTSPDLDSAGALDAVEWVALGFEIIDCPYPGWQFKPVDFVAAFGLHRALVIGEPCVVEAASIPNLVTELANFKLSLSKDGTVVEEGTGKNSLKSPALCLAELTGAILRRPGATPLAAGELISTGTLTAAQPVAKGERWQAEVVGFPLASLSLSFV